MIRKVAKSKGSKKRASKKRAAKKVARKNPRGVYRSKKEFYNDLERKGYQRAMDRYARGELDRAITHGQQDIFLRNTIKALKIHPWQNTVDDWQRLHEARIIKGVRSSERNMARKKRASAKKTARRNPCAKGLWYILYRPNRSESWLVYKGRPRGEPHSWEWDERFTSGKAYKNYGSAKRVYNEMTRRMRMPSGSALAIAVHGEAGCRETLIVALYNL